MTGRDRRVDAAQRIASLSPEKRALLALRLKQKNAGKRDVQEIPARRDATAYPLSSAQERIWFLSQWNPDSPVYNISGKALLTGPLDVDALREALNEILQRHEVLRSSYDVSDGEAVQTIVDDVELPLPSLDLQSLTKEQRAAEVERLANEEARNPFDLRRGPLLRGTLLSLAEEFHVLLFTTHHIVADGWSIRVLLQELASLYSAFANDRPSPLPPLSIQYADFAAWQREWLKGEVLQRQLEYWKRALAGSPPLLEFPTDRSRPSKPSQQGGQFVFRLPEKLRADVVDLARRSGATPFMVLLAAFQALLHRYSGQEDICVGTPIANRNRGETENLIGCFVNTLVLRTRFPDDLNFSELLQNVRRSALEAYDHQDLPFERLVDDFQAQRVQSHNPLFQVMFVLQERAPGEIELGDLRLRVEESHTGTSKFDLMLELTEAESGYAARLEYSTDLFEQGTIERLARHYRELLGRMVRDPERQLSRLPLLSEEERKLLLVEWNETSLEGVAVRTLQEAFDEQVERTPEMLAVVCGDRSLSYRELKERADAVARQLRDRRVGPETLVGLCVQRSLETLVGLLGILKAGGAYVPIEPSYPLERIRYMVSDAGLPLILTQEALRERLPAEGVEIVTLENLAAGSGEVEVESDADPDNVAYVIYTSGSTGRPKGVMVTHRSALNLAAALEARIYSRFDGQKVRVSLNASLAFDASVQQLVALVSGHALVVVPHEARQDGERLLDYVRRTEIDVLDCVPSQLDLLLGAGLLEEEKEHPSVVLPGGEAISEETWRALAAAPDVDFFNMYGITECAVDSVVGRIKDTPGRPTIGCPLANTQVYVLDAHMEPVPVGVPGELYVGGAGVARGYVSQPARTAERFVPNPFGGTSGGRLYRTGDVVRYLPDGNLDFMGRSDGQVKVRGFRIELGEIEVALRELPSVRESVVVASDDPAGGKRLAAYVVLEEGATATVSELRRYLRKRLPEYMVPALFIKLEEMPLTPNGKVDRRALPSPDGMRPDVDKQYVAPRTALERYLVDIWEGILKVRPIGVMDDFFELGGDSIRAAIVTNRLSQDLGKAVELSSVYTASTVLDQCDYLSEKIPEIESLIQRSRSEIHTARTPLPSELDVQMIPRDSELPLSFAQERLWILDQLEPGSPLYNVSGAVRMTGSLNPEVVERSLNEIVRRHEILRSQVKTVAGEPRLEILDELDVPVRIRDLTHLPASQREPESLELASREARAPFDLSEAPLLRVLLVKLDGEDHLLVLTMHHIISDGWSIGILIREFGALYEAFDADQVSPLPELPWQYVDYSHRQRQELREDVLETEIGFWKERLAGSPPLLQLPTDRPRPPERAHRGALATFELSADLSHKLKELCRREAVTPYIALVAAFKTLLFRFTGQDDISIGTPVANRNRADTEDLIGFFVNTLVLRTDLSDNPTFRDLLHQVKESTVEALAHQEFPFERVVQALQPDRALSHSPLFQVMFAHQPGLPDVIRKRGLDLVPVELDSGTARFDLTVSTYEQAGKFRGFVEYDVELFDASTIERIIKHYVRLLKSVAVDADQSLSRVPIIPESDFRRQLVEWNDTSADYPCDRAIHELVEEQVERTPDAIAVVFRGENLSYRTLNERANRLASYLRGLQLGPETLIAVCLPRSADAVIAILGVLKAGYAYVPLDPDYPSERLEYMLRDSNAAAVVTRSDLVERIPDCTVQPVLLDSELGETRQGSHHNPRISVDPAQLAYVIYTSGSTGQPKGTLLSHRGLCNLARHLATQYGIDAETRLLQFASLNFDASVADIFTALANGATLCVADHDVVTSTANLHAALREQDITTVVLPPSVLNVLEPERLPTVDTVVSAGEKCSADVIRRWLRNHQFINAYGPTEVTVCASVYNCSADDVGAPPIGRPIANTRLYVLDRHQRPVPVGVTGELCVGGIGLARGYHNRSDLTAERFIPDSVSGEYGARLYRTGDLARQRENGTIEFLGRIDHQVKIRGFRVELGEIEVVLQEHSGVRDVVAAVRADASGSQRLVAYVVAEEGSDLVVSELRTFLQSRVPDYMVPAVFVELESLPLTPNGKVDRGALPEPGAGRLGPAAEYEAPRTEKEELLAGLWAEVLGVERVGVRDNFFELGGDSILAIQVTARANAAGLKLAPRQVFQFPTVAGLAAASGTGPLVTAEQGVVEGPMPLMPIQRWFLELELPEPHHWNQALLLESRQPLDPRLLEAATLALLEQHDALRLRLRNEGSDWVLHNDGLGEHCPFTSHDLSSLPEDAQSQKLDLLIAQAQSSLDHRVGPIIRVSHFDLGPGRGDRLLIVIHHLAVDGVSWRILLEDLVTAYGQLQRGDRLALPAKTTSFKTWAERFHKAVLSGMFLDETDRWSRECEGAPPQLPLDYPDGKNEQASERSIAVSLRPDETRALLQDVPPIYGTEISDALLAALVSSFEPWIGCRDLFVDLEGHGREALFEDVDVSRTVGWFTSIYPVRLNLKHVHGPGELLTRVKEHLRSLPRGGIGYGALRYLSQELVVAGLKKVRRPAVSFNYLGQFSELGGQDAGLRVAPESTGPSRAPTGKRPHVLSIDATIVGGRLRVRWNYSENLHRAETIEHLATTFADRLREIISHCQTREVVAYTPSDFPEADLSQDDLDSVMSEIGESADSGALGEAKHDKRSL